MKGYRTIIFNVLMTSVMFVNLWNPTAEMPDAAAMNAGLDVVDGAITFIWGAGNAILRAITNSPMFKAE